ncbi:unnamed protein product [Ilex paraguariensis]|uniref:Uncharacterized protein n=1 Tax=Ilex paraguariensis TaxID=185542 RepID=A0ABC8RVS6_9AQUA
MSRSVVFNSLNGFHVKPCPHTFQSFSFNPTRRFIITVHNYGSSFPGNRSSQNLMSSLRAEPIKRTSKMDFAVFAGVQAGGPVPSGPPPNSWKNWILGIVMTVILPLLSHKWGPLLKLKDGIETVVETAEEIAEAVEKVAEEVGKVAEEIADDLPENGKLRNALTFIENVAKETARDAQLADEFIEKVEEVQEKLESFVEEAIDEAKQKSEAEEKSVAEEQSEAAEKSVAEEKSEAAEKSVAEEKSEAAKDQK